MGDASALITGGSSGIGFGLAESLLKDGYSVTIVGRREAKLEDARARLQRFGPVVAAAADVRNDQAILAAVEIHRAAYGGMDLLVNNAGIAVGGMVGETSAKTIDLALAVNLRAAMLFTTACLEMLSESESPYVINVSSLTALVPQPGLSVYAASKAGLLAYTEALRIEVAPRGIRVSVIAPGFVDTSMADAVRSHTDSSDLIRVSDVVAVVNMLLRLSPGCVVPLVAMNGVTGGGLDPWERMMHGALSAT